MTPLQLARRIFAFYALGDKPGVVSLAHPEGAFVFHGDPAGVPWAGTYRGAGIGRFIDTVIDHLDFQEVRVEGVYDAGEHIVVKAFEHHVPRVTGRPFRSHLLGVLSVREGRVAGYEEFNDTAAIERALR